ncbi:MAG: hypothetical protein ACXWDG_11310, partial [Aeromicrobium sp.]
VIARQAAAAISSAGRVVTQSPVAPNVPAKGYRHEGYALRQEVVRPAQRGSGMDDKLTFAAVLWLSGFVAGVVFVFRWRRMGGNQFETSTPEPVPDGASTASPSKVQRTAQRVAGPIVAGAKADLLTVRNATKKVSYRVTSTIGKLDTATVK